jgi:hypothetical protein
LLNYPWNVTYIELFLTALKKLQDICETTNNGQKGSRLKFDLIKIIFYLPRRYSK